MAVSKFLEEKWRKGFRFFNTNRDGFGTKQDLETLAAHISEKNKATEKEKATTKYHCTKWIDILQVADQQVDEDMHCNLLTRFHQDIKSHVRETAATYSAIFDSLDRNDDGLISYEELKTYYAGHGVKNDRFIRKVFDHLDTNKDGAVRREEFVKAGVHYWTSSDENDGYTVLYDKRIPKLQTRKLAF